MVPSSAIVRQYMLLVTQALESLSQQAHAWVKQGQTLEQFQNQWTWRSSAANSSAAMNLAAATDQYFVSPGATRACREAKEGWLKNEN